MRSLRSRRAQLLTVLAMSLDYSVLRPNDGATGEDSAFMAYLVGGLEHGFYFKKIGTFPRCFRVPGIYI